ncbi:NADH-dependent FMN reductase [Candidatus Pacearchaeota archaeon CG10_big_fil_rev_8_21_14_0_10_31_24]|nr:MAG: NADH-dependent FMN reductase [Candidatus Pacearchaeota archaeon CG10_big_fil_rev_8_21_14_0_10_31_24]
MKILIINGSPREKSYTQVLANFTFEYAKTKSDTVKMIDLSQNEIEPFKGLDINYNQKTKESVEHMLNADIYLICSPIYNAFFSSAIKNLFEHIDYKKVSNKKAGFVLMAYGQISFLQVQNQLNSLMNYFSIKSNPKTVNVNHNSFNENMDLTNEETKTRIQELINSTINL